MKILTMVLTTMMMIFVGFAQNPYELVNDTKGYSYIKINEDVGSFTFKSDFKSIGNSGKVGFFVYPNDLEGDALKKYINEAADDNAMFGKKINDGEVDLGALKAGDRVGFYLNRNNGILVRDWNFETRNGTTYIAFDKNDGKGKDEWMPISDIKTMPANNPNGQPLPGTTLMFIVAGIFGIVIYKFNRIKQF